MAEALYINIPSNTARRSYDIYDISDDIFYGRQRRMFIFHTTFIIVFFLALLAVVIWMGVTFT